MPTPTTYTYSATQDFPNGLVIQTLVNEIAASSIVTALNGIERDGDVVSVMFKDQLSSTDRTTLDNDTQNPAGGLIAAHDSSIVAPSTAIQFLDKNGNTQPAKIDSDGYLQTTIIAPSGQKVNYISVNWCDKCSWYEGSTEVTSETLTDSGNGLLFNSAHTHWIDMKHGRMTFEDAILAANPGKWVVSVTSDGVAKTESTPGTIDHDYQVDYDAGTITFNASQAGKTVVAHYWYAAGSQYTIKPRPGYKLTLMRVEVQFSQDIVLNDSAVFQAYGYVQVFAPQYCPTPYPLNTLIPLGTSYVYKSAADYMNESNGTYPIIPAFGGSGWRSSGQPVITLPWEYLSRTEISSAAGMQIVVKMKDDVSHGGELATATFYTIESAE
jgi:hypothetical protein